jgi:hypothetical protein
MAYRDDLSAALARAEAAERALAGVCHVHPGLPSFAACAGCARTFCEACVTTTAEGPRCTACVVAWLSRRRRRRSLVIAAAVTAIGTLVGLYAHHGKAWKPAENPIAKALPMPHRMERAGYATMPNRIRVLRETLLADPCDRAAVRELADLLNRNKAYGETIDANQRFFDKCGLYPQLAWTSILAHQQRMDWAGAVAVSTGLIAHEPTDPDFWWWRGQDRAELGQLAAAIADYRQSMALGGLGFATFRLATAAERHGEHCEGAFAIRYMITLQGRRFAGDTWERFKHLYAAGACDAVNGKGRAVLRYAPGVDLLLAELRLGSETGSVVVDASAPYLTVTAGFARRAGIAVTPNAPSASAVVLGELREGRLATAELADLAGATAVSVPVLVLDELAPGMDGIVGLSFLWRFSLTRDEDRGEVVLSGWSS